MRYLVVGLAGQVGQEFAKLVPEQRLQSLEHDTLDVADRRSVMRELERREFDVVVNLAAFHNVNACEEDSARAFAVNAQGAHNVSLAAAKLGKKIVFVSSDYVFGGRQPRSEPYLESDVPVPLNVYGVSKTAGESLVRLSNPDHLIVRTASLFGRATSRKGWTFPESMIRKARAGERLRVVDDQVMTPTYTLDLVRRITQLIDSDARGLVHVTNGGACSWHELAEATLELAGIGVPVQAVMSAEFPSTAKRPAYSALASERWKTLEMNPLPHWRQALANYLMEIGELQSEVSVACEVSQ